MSDNTVDIVALREILGTSSAVTDGVNEFILHPLNMHILEMEDVLFHLNSAVMMPENPQGRSSSQGSEDDSWDRQDQDIEEQQETATGVRALALVFRQFEFDPAKRMIVAGHTDTSGTAAFNFELSDLRALGVLHLLTGDRQSWAEVSASRHRVEDYQQIMTFFAVEKGWDCDPLGIDNAWGDNTENATRAFFAQVAPEEDEAIVAEIIADPNKKWPVRAWLPVYDLYNELLYETLGIDEAELNNRRSRLRFLDDEKRYVSCGESFPIDDAERDRYRSQRNRRVEVVLLDDRETEDEEGQSILVCPPPSDATHTREECPLWRKDHLVPLYIDPEDLNSVAYHMRFVYFDRVKRQLQNVPEGLQIQAYEILASGGGGRPLTTVTQYRDGIYYVKVRYGNRMEDPNRRFVYFEFETEDQWIYTRDSGATPEIVTLLEGLDDIESAEERWKHYDLPAKWTSKQAWTRYQGTDEDIMNNRDRRGRFTWVFNDHLQLKPIGDEITSPSQPLTFCLDDIVMTDDSISPVSGITGSGALLNETWAVINPDNGNNQCWFTDGGIPGSGAIPFTGDRIHGVIYEQKLYGVFRYRVADGGYAGWRAAVQILAGSTLPEAIMVHRFQQHHYRRYRNLGRFDGYLLRQQGFADGEELSYIFCYFLWKFENADGCTAVTPGWTNTTVTNLVNEWNGGANGPLAALRHQNGSDRYKIPIRFHIEHVTSGQEVTVKVVSAASKERSNMGRSSGQIKENENARNADGAFTAAHEFGHGASLDDDYHERARYCSYLRPGFEDFKPGAPFNLDATSMMKSNQQIRSRHYWHFAAWMYKEFISGRQVPFKVIRDGKPDYEIPYNPTNPWDPRQFNPESRNYVNYPDKTERGQSNSISSRGTFDLYLYPLGEDDYSQGILYPARNFTGLLVVAVNLRFQFWSSATAAEIYRFLDAVHASIDREFRLDHAIKICGNAPYTETFVQVQPRFLVNNYTTYYRRLNKNLTSNAAYQAEVNRLIARPEGTPHFLVDVDDHDTEWDTSTSPDTLKINKDEPRTIWGYFSEMLGLGRRQHFSPTNFAVGTVVPGGRVERV